MKSQAAQHSGRIVLVLSNFPGDSPFLLNKFLGLLDKGLDIHMVCQTRAAAESRWFSYRSLKRAVRSRISFGWPAERRWLVALLLPLLLSRCLLSNLKGSCRYLSRGWGRFGLDVFRRLFLDAQIIRARPDILHFEFGSLAVGRTYLRDLLGCQMVVSFRGYDLNFIKLEEGDYYREVWDNADALHLLGEDLWRRAQARGCPSDKRHALIAPAIDAGFFTPRERRRGESVGTLERPLRIISVGRLVWKKGYDYGLEAVRLLLDRGVQCEYRIIGDGDYFEAVAFACHQLGLKSYVSLLGALSPEEVKIEMEWADLLMHPAVSEGFCNAVLEAQAMKLAVVCTDADGLSENISDGRSGFVVPRRRAKALAEKIELLARDGMLRERMGNVGRQRVLKKFQLAAQLEAFASLYLELLSITDRNRDLVLDKAETAHAG